MNADVVVEPVSCLVKGLPRGYNATSNGMMISWRFETQPDQTKPDQTSWAGGKIREGLGVLMP